MAAATLLRIDYLANHPGTVAVLGEWFTREWGDGGQRRTAATYSAQLSHSANRDRLPICLVGFLGPDPVATATLKFREIEFSAEADFWIGWVCVREDMRGRGFGRALMATAEAQAAARRYSPLYLHTPNKEAFYRLLGWRTIATTLADGRPSTVMSKTVTGA